nr:hypothetical protein BaRGS_016945 [Batillaria attramentaria]
MVPAIERVVKNLQNYIKSKAESGEEVELKHLCQCYAIDSIAGVAFGLQVDSLKDPNDPFIKHGKDFVNFESLYMYIVTGNETVNTVMSFTLFCLAANPDCLAKAQAEIDAKLKKLGPLDRQIAEDMEFGGYHIKKGWRIAIPAFTIHRDPAIWPDPLKFDPERFTPEARATRHPYAFMPFGLGPRNCIGMRLGQLEIRMAIATILQHFTPVLCDKSVYPPKLQKLTMGPVDGLWVKFKARA